VSRDACGLGWVFGVGRVASRPSTTKPTTPARSGEEERLEEHVRKKQTAAKAFSGDSGSHARERGYRTHRLRNPGDCVESRGQRGSAALRGVH